MYCLGKQKYFSVVILIIIFKQSFVDFAEFKKKLINEAKSKTGNKNFGTQSLYRFILNGK
jgi:hypothetical protein